MANVTFKNIHKIYYYPPNDAIYAVNDFNLEIKDNEVIVLVGPSGCGKTSTLRMVAGLEEITKGELYIDDILVNDVHPKDRGIAMVFQNYALFPFMTVFENIAFGLQPTDMPAEEIKEKVEEIARILAIEHLLDRKPKEMSGGQKQRVALARAFIRKCKVVMLDEPLSHLDAKLRAWMRIELKRLHQKFETTFVYVTHDQAEAMTIADRIVVMKDGMIQQVGTPEELYKNPRNLFVAGFLGAPQMNFWETKVTEKDGDVFINYGEVMIKLTENKADKASAYIGKEIIAGVRAEDIMGIEADSKWSDPHFAIIDADVDVREFFGDRAFLHCVTKDSAFVTRILPEDFISAKSGDKVKCAINREKIYLFDKDSELAIVN